MKCSAAHYIDHVMSMTQSLVSDETVFPTKYGLYYVTVTFPVFTLSVCVFAPG